MQTNFVSTSELPEKIQLAIMSAAPEQRQGIKQDLTNTLTQDTRVQFAQMNNSAYKQDDA